MKIIITVVLSLFSLAAVARAGQPPHFDFRLYKKEAAETGPTILIIGGIQGDEPGGFNAAALLATEYTISRGNLWVVPNLNFESIIKRSRGIYGDLNRKFSRLDQNDPEYELIQKIKAIIQDKQIDIVLNLHDGSGFYRKKYIDRLHGPQRWGQSIIIDQETIASQHYGKLMALAKDVRETVNTVIKDKEARYHVRNTRTREGDVEMEKTLTYFSIRNQKPAFGLEVSKEYRTHERVYYHLLLVESFMRKLGIKFERSFALQKAAVKDRIDNHVKLSINDGKIYLDVANARRRLTYVPLKKSAPVDLDSNSPLMAIINDRNGYKVRYGNRHVTYLQPQYFDYDSSLEKVSLEVDGQAKTITLGSIVDIKNSLLVDPLPGYRANIIGFKKAGLKNEVGVLIRRNDISSRFSVDRKARLFRLEFYKDNKYCGMLLLRFNNKNATKISSLSTNIRVSSP
ncbi:Putative periplasmic protein [hydrothermal vent metagenome]|uniref:Periplasmic protein n=1 Tax=hydrothermal vent metagenome TaxID=652676 RepID=A0A3B1B0N7_9ZZZZ